MHSLVLPWADCTFIFVAFALLLGATQKGFATSSCAVIAKRPGLYDAVLTESDLHLVDAAVAESTTQGSRCRHAHGSEELRSFQPEAKHGAKRFEDAWMLGDSS